MDVPEGLRYTDDHEWVRVDGSDGVVGITAYAAEQLGDVVFVELPQGGQKGDAGSPPGEVESTTSVSEIFAPVSGEVTAVNNALDESPELINSDPYGDGWLVEIAADDPAAVDGLMDAKAYQELTESA